MRDVKIIRNKFLLTLGMLVLIILGIVGISIAVGILVPDDNIKVIILFIIGIGSIAIALVFKKRFDEVLNWSYSMRILNDPGEPLPIVNLTSVERLSTTLESDEFLFFRKAQEYSMFYRIKKDKVKKILSKNILEIVIMVTNRENSFYVDAVNDDINRLQDSLTKKQRANILLVTQFKEVPILTNGLKEAIKEIIFIRTRYGVISTINVALDKSSKKAVMLYGNTYSPSLYYKEHLEFIKKII